MHAFEYRPGARLPRRLALVRRSAPKVGFDRVERADPGQRLGRDGRVVGDVNVVELATYVCLIQSTR